MPPLRHACPSVVWAWVHNVLCLPNPCPERYYLANSNFFLSVSYGGGDFYGRIIFDRLSSVWTHRRLLLAILHFVCFIITRGPFPVPVPKALITSWCLWFLMRLGPPGTCGIRRLFPVWPRWWRVPGPHLTSLAFWVQISGLYFKWSTWIQSTFRLVFVLCVFYLFPVERFPPLVSQGYSTYLSCCWCIFVVPTPFPIFFTRSTSIL